ncbi:GntR family transcriptional regulator [Azospirillum sp. TSO35-2]|uniref:GntR family transcriptional regulator n=1 Tax=Azospirillum sp. TSO35-2 TaxID=716796 RepID=UPI000D6159C9|nr:GntR family transcriptional regulator [Azospirillum sp. TSO35-2]PWC32714.1 GntR family transcriptional regulator [Azospirillum sp. TSO35-2]
MEPSLKKVATTQDEGGLASATARRTVAPMPSVRPTRRAVTVASTIYRDLRSEIVSLKRKPGEPIAEKQIAEAYGVSRTPVREAVLKLADEGLIEIFPQSGTFVSRIPLDALPEAFAIRKALEEATVRYAAERATRSQIAMLRANLELQREMQETANYQGFHQADETFHALVAEIAGYPGFWTLIQQTKVQIDRYRLLTLPVRGRIAEVIAEHTAIVEALAANDAVAAIMALDAHLDDLQISVDDVRASYPRYFTAPGDPA